MIVYACCMIFIIFLKFIYFVCVYMYVCMCVCVCVCVFVREHTLPSQTVESETSARLSEHQNQRREFCKGAYEYLGRQ